MSSPSSRFNRIAEPLAAQVVQQLENEHTREISELYKEQFMLRSELTRCLDLMETEMIPREKMLHDLVEKMQGSLSQATLGIQGFNGQDNSRTHEQRRQMLDPLEQAERELVRIQQLLTHQVATAPDLPPDLIRKAEVEAGVLGGSGSSRGAGGPPPASYARGPTSSYATGPASSYATGPASSYATGPAPQYNMAPVPNSAPIYMVGSQTPQPPRAPPASGFSAAPGAVRAPATTYTANGAGAAAGLSPVIYMGSPLSGAGGYTG